ncbi:phage terminase small subunit P27 family [Mycolicibacterium peregrinum]|uniref:phage terminase small subunit P27 family n=1 Tax=Mycolicibacterium peregrinum TaxID=43304 RepID=UPI0006D845F5|nr:phage terminase small subunit P27 family [Mycolicibacterium peregrinum]MCV7205296.1 phage terminase small subunit P27 family [Mycolicibacterium peregrinum]ORW54806.1 terminase [Mycolicibacterium peregrinum]
MAPAKPARLKVLNGRGDGKDSAGRPIPTPPKFIREAPEPPEWLDGEALAEWRRVAPDLETLDLLKPADRATLTAYCETWARFVSAVAEYKAHGLTLINPDSGRVGKNPAVSIAEAAATQLRAFANDFGLSPAAERTISTTAKTDGSAADDDPFDGSGQASSA